MYVYVYVNILKKSFENLTYGDVKILSNRYLTYGEVTNLSNR